MIKIINSKIKFIGITIIVIVFSLFQPVITQNYSGIVGYGDGPNGPVIFVENENVILPLSHTNKEVVVTGKFYTLDNNLPYTDKYRPAFPGVSIGHFFTTAGTLGAIVYDKEESYILSANHIIANADGCLINDPILQPSFLDGGLFSDVIANLTRWTPIERCDTINPIKESCPENKYDAAIAKIINSVDVIDTNPPKEAIDPYINQNVYKIGRTSGETIGIIMYTNADVMVCCYLGSSARFTNQIISTNYSLGGDSGSLLRDSNTGNAVGILYAGSANYSISSPIIPILEELNVSFLQHLENVYFPIISK